MAQAVNQAPETKFIVSADANDHQPKVFRQLTVAHHFCSKETPLEIVLSASGQYSVKGLKTLHMKASERQATLHVFNLREEPHFMIEGHAITHNNGFNNDANRHLTIEQIQAKEDATLAEVREAKSIEVHSDLKKRKEKHSDGTQTRTFYYASQTKLDVTVAHKEEDCVKALGAHYTRVLFTDHNPQGVVKNVDHFVQAALKAFREGHTWLHFHCHEGKGRAAMAVLISSVMVHAKTHSLDQIIDKFKSGEEYFFEKKKYKMFTEFFGHFHSYCKEADITKETWIEFATRKEILEPLLQNLPKNRDEKRAKKAKTKPATE